jgi:hypothetical protein
MYVYIIWIWFRCDKKKNCTNVQDKRFLWCGRGAKAKDSWTNVCFPKKECGLGIK